MSSSAFSHSGGGSDGSDDEYGAPMDDSGAGPADASRAEEWKVLRQRARLAATR